MVPDWANSSVTKNQGIDPGPVVKDHQTISFLTRIDHHAGVDGDGKDVSCEETSVLNVLNNDLWQRVSDLNILKIMMRRQVFSMFLRMTCGKANDKGDDGHDGHIGHCWNRFL